MQKLIKLFSIVAISAVSCYACKKDSSGDGPAAQKGYVTGVVKDSQGHPIAGADINISNPVYFNSAVQTKADNNGKYKAAIPSHEVFVAYASKIVQYNGRTYQVYMSPDNFDSFIKADSPVRNFTWKLSGQAPTGMEGSSRGYWGGSVSLYTQLAREKVEVTFTPDGPLIDGSTGQIVKKRVLPTGDGYYSAYIIDVPIGRYTVTAQYDDGTALQVADGRSSDLIYSNSVTMNFAQSGTGPIDMQLHVQP